MPPITQSSALLFSSSWWAIWRLPPRHYPPFLHTTVQRVSPQLSCNRRWWFSASTHRHTDWRMGGGGRRFDFPHCTVRAIWKYPNILSSQTPKLHYQPSYIHPTIPTPIHWCTCLLDLATYIVWCVAPPDRAEPAVNNPSNKQQNEAQMYFQMYRIRTRSCTASCKIRNKTHIHTQERND